MRTKTALLVAIVIVAGLAWTFVKRPLPVPKAMGPLLPDVTPVAGVSLSVVRGGAMESQQGFSVRGASLTTAFTSGLVAFVVEHPSGYVLIDAGVARDVEAHLQTTPWLMRALATLQVELPTIDALAERALRPSDIDAVILTHAHWDHVSGLADLREVPVWITPEELAHARSEDEGGKLYRQLEEEKPLKLEELVFESGPHGPFRTSHDFFGDGTIVVVPMPGHTPGSVGVFVTDWSAKRFLIIGDTAWAREGVEWPAEKPWLARRMVDHDAAAVREQLVLLHRLQRANPDLLIIPSHDARVHAELATF